ncbi:MAG: ABC transporter permease [Solirubrobacterales bacterium]|nr:ABC transporter permease [Solirubrobacterales bacterium]
MSTMLEQPTPSTSDLEAEPRRVTVIEAGRRGGQATGFKRGAALAWTLALTDWRLRFYGSALGGLWTLVRPFAFFGVVYVVFTEIIGLDENIKNYGVYILFGMVFFQFFSEITTNSVMSLVARENLLRKMYFPPLVIPVAIAITALLNLSMTLVAVFIFVLANGIFPQWAWLELPLLIVLLTTFALGIGMLLSSLYVRFRDIQPMWEVFTQLLFYASPILYVATFVPPQYQRPFLANPIASILTQVRHSIVDPTAKSAGTVIGGNVRLLIPLAIIFGTFALGYFVFRRESPRIAENL